MTYKLNPELRVIKSPVVLVIDGEERSFPDGKALVGEVFDKNYVVASITARDDIVVIELEEGPASVVVNWIGEEAVSFM